LGLGHFNGLFALTLRRRRVDQRGFSSFLHSSASRRCCQQ